MLLLRLRLSQPGTFSEHNFMIQRAAILRRFGCPEGFRVAAVVQK